MTVKEILVELGYTICDAGNSYRSNALYRGGNNRTSLIIDKNSGNWKDFVSGENGKLDKLVALTLKVEIPVGRDWLKNKNYSKIEETDSRPLLKMEKFWQEEDLRYLFPQYDYWEQRGISKETLQLFGGGVAHNNELKMLRRFVFPIRDESGQIHGLSGRTLVNKEPKWKHLGPLKNRFYPYYFNRQFIEESKEVILVESIGDMLALWEAGFKNSIVIWTTSMSDTVIANLIKVAPRRIIIATNNDEGTAQEAGNRGAEKIFNKLIKFFDRDQVDDGVPVSYNDLGEILEKTGVAGIKKWYGGLTI